MSLVRFLSSSLCSSPEISLTELFYIRLIYCDSKFRPGPKRPGPALVLTLVKYRTLGARTWDPRTHYFQFTSKEEWEFLNEILRKITLNKRKGTNNSKPALEFLNSNYFRTRSLRTLVGLENLEPTIFTSIYKGKSKDKKGLKEISRK